MTLSKQTAQQIVDVVSAAQRCREIIGIQLAGMKSIFSLFGAAGTVRNLVLLPFSEQLDKYDCIGVVNVSIEAINHGRAKIPGLKTVKLCQRVVDGWEHKATNVVMTDGSEYAFDWHKTLDASNPWLSPIDNWRKGQNATAFIFFNGFA